MGLNLAADQAIRILSTLLSSFTKKENDEGPVYPSSTSSRKKEEGKEASQIEGR